VRNGCLHITTQYLTNQTRNQEARQKLEPKSVDMDPTPCSPVRGGAAGDAQGAGKWPSSLVLGTLTSSLRITSLNSRLIRDTAMFAMMILLFLGLSLLSSSLRYSPHCSLRSTFSFLRLSSSPRCSILPLFLLLAPVQFCGF